MNDEAQTGSITAENPKEGQFPPLRFDPEAYIQYVKEADLTETEAHQLLEAVWLIMTSFVDLRFGIHPVQQAMCARAGVVRNDADTLDQTSALLVSCGEAFREKTLNNAALRPDGPCAGNEDS